MKILLLIVTLCLTSVYCQVSLFQATFEKLHHEPRFSTRVFRDNIDVKYIEQKLDNFNENDNRTWRMRYMSNDHFFKDGGPIFILAGGEWEISDLNLRGGHMYDMAKFLNGYMFYTEHRYYGRSQPFRTLETNNLKYLNVKQALADLAHVIRNVKSTVAGSQNSKVILVGGSYSASMVTWFSRLYPDLVDGAWASCAPLLAKVDFFEAKQIAGAVIAEVGGEACYNRIESAIAAFERDVDNGNLDTIKQFINICPDFDMENEKDVMVLFASISDIFSALVQIHVTGTIENVCSTLMSASSDIEGVGNFLRDQLQAGSQCVRVKYENYVNLLQQTDLDGIMRQWYYQSCNEFGWFQTSGSDNQPFGSKFPVELFINLCRDIYGIEYNMDKAQQNVEATNEFFGGLNPQVKNVYFTHGALDPWHALGVICDGECGALVPFYTHVKDLPSANPNDTQEMLNAKQTIFELVKRWTQK